MKNMNFSIDSYKYLIDLILNSGRKIIGYKDLLLGNKGLIMRHDIDFCPLRANELAILENKKHIKAVYFVLVKSGLYDFKEAKNLEALNNILDLGPDVALHFDSSNYASDKFSLDKGCRKECDILENYIKKEIEIVSFHRPEKRFIGMQDKIGGKNHTYMPLFVNKTKYCSDSEGKWRYDDPEELINDYSINNIHLLTHPIWWTTPEELTAGEKIAFHLKGADKMIQALAAENCKPYKLYISLKKN